VTVQNHINEARLSKIRMKQDYLRFDNTATRIQTNVSSWLVDYGNWDEQRHRRLQDILDNEFPESVLHDSGKYKYYAICFKHPEDAIMFKLKYGEYCE
jgi:hypothetical protein